MVGVFLPTAIQPMGKLLNSRIFIKSVVDWTNLKLGMVITKSNNIVQKKFRCHSNMP